MRKTGVYFIVVGVRAVWLLAARSVDKRQTRESGTLGERLSKGIYGMCGPFLAMEMDIYNKTRYELKNCCGVCL
jgi:hypothetical protein